jgi:hypothetical protein
LAAPSGRLYYVFDEKEVIKLGKESPEEKVIREAQEAAEKIAESERLAKEAQEAADKLAESEKQAETEKALEAEKKC